MRHEIVRDADVLHAAVGLEFLERAPRFLASAFDGPVNEIEVDRLQCEALRACIERAKRFLVAVIVVPELGRDEDFATRNLARANPFSDVFLISVDARRVDVAVPEPERRRHRIARLSAAA